MVQNNAFEVFRGGWDQLEHAVFTDNEGPTSTSAVSFTVKPDGTEVYLLDGNVVKTFSLTIPHDPNTINTTPIRSFTVTEDTSPIGITFQQGEFEGTKMFIGGQDGKVMLAYTLPDAFNTDSIVASPASLSLSDIVGTLINSTFSRDGDFFFTTSIGPTRVHSFPMPTNWDIISNVSSDNIDPGIGTLLGIDFKPEGDKMYLIDATADETVEFDLPTINDITTATANGNVLEFTGNPVFDIKFRSTGKEVLFLDDLGVITRFHLDDQWDTSTGSHFRNSFNIADTNSVWWAPPGRKYFGLVSTGISDRIDQYVVPNRWNTTDTALPTPFDLGGIASNPRGFWWNRPGTRCILVDAATITAKQLNLTTGFDIDTIGGAGISSPSLSPATFPEGIAFTQDELTFYIADSGTNTIYQFDISTLIPLDIANMVYSGNSFPMPGTSITDIRLSPDDKFLYVSDRTGELVIRLSLPADKNVTNAVILDDLFIGDLETNIRGFYIREVDGKKLYIVGQSANAIVSMDMTLEFNNSIINTLGDELVNHLGEAVVYS